MRGVTVQPTWRKSSHSTPTGSDCVEVANLDGAAMLVRDSKAPNGPRLALAAAEWRVFAAAVKRRPHC
ncbi:DUF397 domain-containing protein [Actinomadura gamaensis]|uniref:DUF397 domain-containing protein n=1 Tax=Actinomadura gamaensis TaxID=1763541 RepID=A0ABV9U5I3_9ACTN